jgi:hypothetical protein
VAYLRGNNEEKRIRKVTTVIEDWQFLAVIVLDYVVIFLYDYRQRRFVMKRTDKFFIGIVVGVILLVVVVFVYVLSPSGGTYMPDDSPEGVMHNYMLALQKKDYERAYSYLSPKLSGYPKDVNAFIGDVRKHSPYFWMDSVTISVDRGEIIGGTWAAVEVRESSFDERNIFDIGSRIRTYEFRLQLEEGSWRIYDMEEVSNWSKYFLWCWKEMEGCN